MTHCCFNAATASRTVGQQWNNIRSAYRVRAGQKYKRFYILYYMYNILYPANTKHLYNIGTMLDHRLRRCYTNVSCLLGICTTWKSSKQFTRIKNIYPVWLGRLTHLLRQAQSHWPPFCFHSQLCRNDTRAAYQKTRMPWNWYEYFKCLQKLGHFQQA